MEVFKEDGSHGMDSTDEREQTLKTILTREDIENIDLPSETLVYDGEGESSYSAKYDKQKAEFLKVFGIETEDLDHAEIVTAFIIFSHIDTLKYIEKMGGDLDEPPEKVLQLITEKLLSLGSILKRLSITPTIQDTYTV